MNDWKRHLLGVMEAWGNPSPELLLQPGAGGQAYNFRTTVKSLTVPASALNLPGHATHSGALLTTIEQMAEAVEGAINALGTTTGRPIVLLGHSMGGGVAIEVALRRKVKLSGLILYSTGARLRVGPMIFESLEKHYDVHTRQSARTSFGSAVTDEILDSYLKLPRHPTNVQVLNDFRAADRFDRMADVGKIVLPTLVIGGDSDALTPAKYQAYLADRIPGAERVILSGAGHMGHLEKPQEFRAAVQGFMEKLSGRTRL